MLGIQLTVLAELIGMLKGSGCDVGRALDVVTATPVSSPVAKHLADSMLAGNFTPQFPVELIEKDFRYALELAGSSAAPTIEAAHRVFCEAISRGLGRENMTSVVRLFL
jgi:3-hydroxyisobutyrate dehydrogenase